jgi:hypothetical protein
MLLSLLRVSTTTIYRRDLYIIWDNIKECNQGKQGKSAEQHASYEFIWKIQMQHS